MLNNINIKEIKEKLSNFISYLHTTNKISLEQINEKIINDDYFDFLERNKTNELLDLTYASFLRELYGVEEVFEREEISEIVWAIESIVSISINKSIPLKQVFLLCPIEEMIKYFNPYHEMNEKEIVEEFINNNYKKSILRILRKRSNISISKLSKLTGVKESTIKYYELKNSNLFNGNLNNILKIQECLNISMSFFKEQSTFVPYTTYILEESDTYKLAKEYLTNYYGYNGDIKKDGLKFIYISKNKKVYIEDNVMSSTVRYIVINYNGDNLLF